MSSKVKQRRRRGVTPLSVVGELLITVGALLMLYVVWELWWTNIQAGQEQQAMRDEVVSQFEEEADEDYDGTAIDTTVPEFDESGPGWGVLYVPRLGEDFSVPVTDGVGNDVIDHGVLGRYPDSAGPGEEGNMSFAGHRQTHGSILWDMDQVVPGDKMYVETANGWWIYETAQNHIVTPSDISVLDPNPMNPGTEADGQWLTITTCHPLFSTRERMVTHAEMVEFVPRDAGAPEAIAANVAS